LQARAFGRHHRARLPQAAPGPADRPGINLDNVERSAGESFTWTGEYLADMNTRTTHKVGINVPGTLAAEGQRSHRQTPSRSPSWRT